MTRFLATIVALTLALAGCTSTLNMAAPQPSKGSPPSIQHVVVLLQENRSFNMMFMKFPGAETSTTGQCKEFDPPKPSKPVCPGGQTVTLHPIPLKTGPTDQGKDIEHDHRAFEIEYDGGKMDGFGSILLGTNGVGQPFARKYPYAYVVRRDIQPYWDMANSYALADHMFSTATTDSFVAHQQIIAGTTRLNAQESITNVPSNRPWGCDAYPSEVTDLITVHRVVLKGKGPFPCLTQYKTMADVLDAANISWRYYVESYDPNSPYFNFSGQVWNAFDAIKGVRYGPDWKNVEFPNTRIFKDIEGGTLPQVSWVIPHLEDSDHPACGCNTGPSWVTSVVNALGKSQYWKNTAIVVLWDDWGGFYDPVPPRQPDYTSLGMRVPMIVISPFAKRHHVSKTQYEFGSVLRFIEENFGTGSLDSTDVRANSIGNIFDFSQQPGKFQPFSAPYSESYFFQHRTQPSPDTIMEHDDGAAG